MKLAEAIKQLDANDKMKGRVQMGPVRALAKTIKTDHPLALQLWETGRADARILASMVMSPKELTPKQVEKMLASLDDFILVDELTYKAVAGAPFADDLSRKWIASKKELTGRAGWNLLVTKLQQKRLPSDECDAILKTIDAQKRAVPVKTQEAMMRCLVEIGVGFPEHRKRSIDIGNRWGIIEPDRPVSKGCTPFHAVMWIDALLKRKA
jgi:3-methyladenine DNA glycosylase AlkD